MFRPKFISPGFIVPNLTIGIGRVLDIGASLSKMPYTSYDENKNIAAISHDWQIIGNDLCSSVSAFKYQNDL